MKGKCKCTLAISLNGDGCRYCQPQESIDRLEAEYKDIDSENDKLIEALETLKTEYTVRGEDAYNLINKALGVIEPKSKQVVSSKDLHADLFEFKGDENE